MATKGASNHYGNARGGRKGESDEYIGYAWAKGFNKNRLKQHVNDHAKQMKCSNANEYVAKAIHFANVIDRVNCKSFIVKNGTTYKYNKMTNEFAIITKDGYVVTYYTPTEGYKYYLEQREKFEYRRKK